MDIKKILFRTNSIDVEKALPDAIIFCQKDGKIQWVNDKATEIFETSRMHLLTSNISDFIENSANMIDSSIITNKSVITKRCDVDIYYDMTSKEIDDGYVLDFRDSQHEVAPVANNIEDDNVNYNKNDFLLKLSNDLKSPLQSIVGFSQAMADGLGGAMSEQQEKYIRIINKHSSDLMYFVTKLMELSKTENGFESIENKPFDIVSLISSLVRFNEQLYKEKEIKWNLITDENIKKTFISDENLVKKILQNLFEVIIKSIEMGDISVDLKIPDDEILTSQNVASGNYILITAKSSSLLMSENDLESMFDPYKIIDTTNRKNLLRAMILASIKNQVQALNGFIWVESQILKSTSFNILLPQGCD